MPLYDAVCRKCGEKENIWAKMDETLVCECGREMTRLISLFNVRPDMQPYVDTDMDFKGVQIKSRRHHKEMMKKHGVDLR